MGHVATKNRDVHFVRAVLSSNQLSFFSYLAKRTFACLAKKTPTEKKTVDNSERCRFRIY